MAIEGAIAARTRGILPVTWDALSKDTVRAGDGLLQTAIDIAKESVTGEVIDPDDENQYALVMIDYIAKVAALQLIPSGIDYWMNEPISESATGTNENHTFTERVAALQDLRKALLEETRKAAPLIPGATKPKRSPLSNTIDEPFITPHPLEFPRPYIETNRT